MPTVYTYCDASYIGNKCTLLLYISYSSWIMCCGLAILQNCNQSINPVFIYIWQNAYADKVVVVLVRVFKKNAN